MNIFDKTTLALLKKNKARTIVTIIGVILSVTMICGIITFVSSLQNYIVKGEIQSGGDWYAAVHSLNENQLKKIKNSKEVAKVISYNAVGYSKALNSKNEYKPYIFIVNTDDDFFDQMNIDITLGRIAKKSNEIVLSAHLATNGGINYKVGDKIKLNGGFRKNINGVMLSQEEGYENGETLTEGKEKTYTITGICERPYIEPYQAPGYTAFTVSGVKSTNNYVAYIKTKNPEDIYSFVKKHVADNSKTEYNVELLSILGVSKDLSDKGLLMGFGAILISLIILGTIALIYNAFSISINERKKQLGLLSSIGATKKQLNKTLLFEGLFISVVGIPIGLILGIIVIGITLHFVSGLFSNILGDDFSSVMSLKINWVGVLISGLIAFITVMISAWLPAKRGSKASPLDAIQQTKESHIKQKKLRTTGITAKLFGLPGLLAAKNFRRNKKKYRLTIVSLILSIVLFISASAIGTYIEEGIAGGTGNDGDYDISYSIVQGRDKNLNYSYGKDIFNKLKNAKGITEGAFMEVLPLSMEVNNNQVDGTIILMNNTDYNKWTKDNLLSPKKIIISKKVNIYNEESGNYIKRSLTKKNDNVEIRTEYNKTVGTEDFQITNILPIGVNDYSSTQIVIMSRNMAKNLLGSYNKYVEKERFVFLSSSPQLTYNSMTKICKRENLSQSSLYNKASDREAKKNMLAIIKIFAGGFIILISLIATANVFNTISTSVMLRKRELATLKALGMSQGDFKKMMNLECWHYGAWALIYGLPIAVALNWPIYKVFADIGNGGFIMPWNGIIISVISVFLVVFATMIYATRRIDRENMVDVLRNVNL